MKYKVIKLEDNKSILVNESAGEIGSFRLEYMSNIGNPYTRIYDSMNGNTIMEIDKIDKGRIGFTYEIIATINHSISLDVPMIIVEDDVEIITEILCTKKGNENNSIDLNAYALGIIDGYKAAQQKGTHSDEAMLFAYIEGGNDGAIYESMAVDEDYEAAESFSEESTNHFIKSLKQEYIELEMEEVFHKGTQEKQDDGSIIFKKAEIPVTLEIKTNRVKGQLMAYLKQ
jgi:hypothetical protein